MAPGCEVFCRRWLQTRWEHIIGRWPAIVPASLPFAAWHIGIHGSGRLPYPWPWSTGGCPAGHLKSRTRRF
ncbi:CPBP family intramembrane glutamic endopeptidase [Streptosporangium roseum]|uniref:CPBP family intramembrane glutamic endopeptidase n=1 Tax=Streptosporangium roseum TaxID=2001 RepID=UPI001E3E3513|nr:CPBP family intramembrane glutamic endopeptidase [Streptosporangium roseum]